MPEFDFLVIGSGPGGAVVASRLAIEFPQKTVVIIEAGPEAPVNVVAPGMFPFGLKIEGTTVYYANKSPNYGNGFQNGMKSDVGKFLEIFKIFCKLIKISRSCSWWNVHH